MTAFNLLPVNESLLTAYCPTSNFLPHALLFVKFDDVAFLQARRRARQA